MRFFTTSVHPDVVLAGAQCRRTGLVAHRPSGSLQHRVRAGLAAKASDDGLQAGGESSPPPLAAAAAQDTAGSAAGEPAGLRRVDLHADGTVTYQFGSEELAAAKQQQPVSRKAGQAAAGAGSAKRSAGVAFPKARTLEGVACLMMVAFLWGSYGPALRIAYNMPGGPTPVAVAAVSALIELVVLISIVLARLASRRGQAAAAPPLAAQAAALGAQLKREPGAAGRSSWRWLALPAAVLAGLEIGLYNALANCAEIGALALTTATRSAFLIQASILFVPILSSFAGMAPSRSVWVGSVLALVGTVIITQDPSGAVVPGVAAAVATGGLGLAAGDVLTLLAALFYSFATVRMPVWSVRHEVTPLQLALGKSTFLTAVATTAAGVCAAWLAAAGQPVTALWPGWRQPAGWAIMLWAALGPGALASVLHVRGQSIVPPAPSRIILGGVPLWAALISSAVLREERVGLITCVGGALIAAAGMTAAMAGRGAVKVPALAAS